MGAASITMNEAAEWQPAVNPWIIAIAVTLATFMEVLDTSIANVALPHIAGSLSAGTDESTWVLTSYLVSNAIVLPLSGWLSSIIGRKHFYMGCVALFTISSFLCGLAPNLPMLIVFRILQGAGGGGLQPSEQAILADTFAPVKRRKLSETRIDYTGLGFVALELGTLQVVLDKGQRDDWFESNFIVALTVVSVVSLIFVVFWEWRHKDPIIDLHLFRERTFATANFLMFMLGFALLGSTLLLPLFMQTLLGYTAERAGLALMPGGFTIMVAMPIVGFLLSRYSPRYLMMFGLSMLSFSLFHMTSFDLGVDFHTVTMARVYQAMGLAFLFVPINTTAYSGLPRDKNNAASGLMNLARNIGGSVGISVVTTLLARRTQFHQVRLTESLSAANPVFQSRLHGLAGTFAGGGSGPGSGPGSALQHAYAMIQANVIQQSTMLAYVDIFWLLGAVIFCLIPFVFLIRKPKPGGEIVVH